MIGLRQQLIRTVLTSGLLIAATVAIAAGVFYIAQKQWAYNQTISQLESMVPGQIKDLAASFLIPEQSAGRDLLLQKYSSDENLESIKVVGPNENLPENFSNCKKEKEPTRCDSADGNLAATLTPIKESDVIFGYLLKAKANNSQGFWIIRYAVAAFAALALVMITVIVLLLKMYSRVSSSLIALEEWIDRVMFRKNNDQSPQVHFDEFRLLGERIKNIIDEGEELKKQGVISEIANQVAHDIRGPVTALSVMVECMNKAEISEENRMAIVNSAQRINEIADKLVSGTWESKNYQRSNVTSLSQAINQIVLEKQFQYKFRSGVEISSTVPKDIEIQSTVDSIEIKRVLSNLINNSIEALSGAGRVQVLLGAKDSTATIQIIDNGNGIPEDVLEKLGEKGVTDKERGTGLGVHHAIKTIREYGGNINFESQVGHGTSVTITLPKVEIPNTQPSLLILKPSTQIIVVDDDPIIHRAWDVRFADISGHSEQSIDVLHFYSGDELKAWFSKTKATGDRIFLMDYELSDGGPTGLDLIKELGISENSILISGRGDDPEIQLMASEIGVRCLSKHLASSISIIKNTIGLNIGGSVGSA